MMQMQAQIAADDTLARVLAFAREFSESHVILAMHAALPPGLTPELVHLLRINFVPSAPWIAEADLLLSPLCREAGGDSYEMPAAVRDMLLGDLRSDPDFGPRRVRDLADFLLAYADRALLKAHNREALNFFEAQRFAALAYKSPQQASAAIARALQASLAHRDAAARRSETLRLSQLANSLAAPLFAEEKVMLYAAGAERAVSGDVSAAATWFAALGPSGSQTTIAGVTVQVPEFELPATEAASSAAEAAPESVASEVEEETPAQQQQAQQQQAAPDALAFTAPAYEFDLFLSYARDDDRSLLKGGAGWVEEFRDRLLERLQTELGQPVRILEQVEPELLQRTAVFLPIVSPAYANSEYSMQELQVFLDPFGNDLSAAGGRIFKVVKTPVRQPEPLSAFRDFEFYDSRSGRAPELSPRSRDFASRMSKLVAELVRALTSLRTETEPAAQSGSEAAPAVYLASTTADLEKEYIELREWLQARGYRVLPDQQLPQSGPQVVEVIEAYLQQCRFAIHLIGTAYSAVPEGETRSLLQLQNDLAAARTESADMERVIWIEPERRNISRSQSEVIDYLRGDRRAQRGAELIDAPFDKLLSYLDEKLPPAGGEAGDLGSVAEAIFQSLSPSQQRLAATIFKHMVEFEPNSGALVAVQTTQNDLMAVSGADRRDVLAVIDRFQNSTPPLLQTEQQTGSRMAGSAIRIADDSLLQQWTRLMQWAEEEQEAAQTYLRLAEQARLYAQGSEALLADVDLTEALAWRNQQRPTQAWAARYDEKAFEPVMRYIEESARQERAAIRIYLQFSEKDEKEAQGLYDLLSNEYYTVFAAPTDGGRFDRSEHEERLATCDAFVVYYGHAPDGWVRHCLQEIERFASSGRRPSPPPVMVFMAPPESRAKQAFTAEGVMVVGEFEPANLAALKPFLQALQELPGAAMAS